MMTWLERWMLKRIAKRIVGQIPHHNSNIVEYYKIIEDAAREEFTEDNRYTLNCLLDDCFEAARNGLIRAVEKV